jgi:hypothetical protein
MLFMVIETFKNPDLVAVRERFQSEGRLMPAGLTYISSWMTPDGSKCFQLMDSPSQELLEIWFRRWSDLVFFQAITVENSADFWHHWNQKLQ